MKVFLISPVRGISDEEKNEIEEYVISLEKRGRKVYWPLRDTDQDDETGYRICFENRKNMSDSEEIHIWWNEKYQDSVFDFGMAFMLQLFLPEKYIVIANPKAISRTPSKSFNNVLLQIREWNEILKIKSP